MSNTRATVAVTYIKKTMYRCWKFQTVLEKKKRKKKTALFFFFIASDWSLLAFEIPECVLP